MLTWRHRFTLFKGTAGCDGNATEVEHIGIPSGEEQICVTGGVQDGGKFEKASGMWVCSSG
jgi:hypothetical protein